jgi:hypothetical protein
MRHSHIINRPFFLSMSPCCMSMLLVHAACSIIHVVRAWRLSMLHVHTARLRCLSMLHINAVCLCCTPMLYPLLHVHSSCPCLNSACSCCKSLLHFHAACTVCDPCPCCVSMLYICPCCVHTLHFPPFTFLFHFRIKLLIYMTFTHHSNVHASCPCLRAACSCCISMLHGMLHELSIRTLTWTRTYSKNFQQININMRVKVNKW